MASKSATKEIKKYSGVANKAKTANEKNKTQTNQSIQQEEPRISQEQVIKAFESFGFQPNERNNEIGYWTTRPVSEGAKLMEELYKRRQEMNDEEDLNKKSKQTLPRLSDEEISAFYDEYGLPTPDPEWARNHLPNDPNKIRSLLEMQRKTTDDMIKNEAKMATTPQPMAQQQPQQMPTMTMPNGMGGPTPMDGMPISQAKPFFIGDHSIVRITNPNNPNSTTTWLVDSKKKVLRPFMSEEAFQNAFENPAEAEKSVVTISSKELGPGGVLEGFSPLQGGKGVRGDGSMDRVDFSPASIKRNYGKPIDPNVDNKAISLLDGLFGAIKQQQPQPGAPMQQPQQPLIQ
ncbi:MAG: hypothetical protein KKH44_05325 [Bacteroidetes bacterium]|nr:hypothetical protein [Bacteroidota bacterium]